MALWAAKVKKENAESLRRYLSAAGKLDKKYRVYALNSFIYLPVLGEFDVATLKKMRTLKASIVRAEFEKAPNELAYKELLAKSLGKKRFGEAVKSYDLFGDIAVIEDKLNAKKIAAALLRSNKRIRTVLLKASAVAGRYRTRKFSYVAGDRHYIANYKENGCTFKFDIRKVFFSPRLSFERRRVSELVKNKENVLVMFAGVGPFAIEIAKLHKRCTVVAVELNKSAYNYMLENIALNKTPNVIPELGDVAKVAGRYGGFADRIIMPLPKSSSRFLGSALLAAKKRCTIHYYTFCPSDKKGEARKALQAFFKKEKKKLKFVGERVVRPYSPTEIEAVFDFTLLQ